MVRQGDQMEFQTAVTAAVAEEQLKQLQECQAVTEKFQTFQDLA
tara:strand:- start:132 stop:263 length:132 start_codon:yes stop_codon:yes gene_type:complete